MKFFNYILLVLLALTLVFCSKEAYENQPVNAYGGSNRANNYEEFGSFWSQLYYADKIKCSDSSGAIIAPIAMPNADIVYASTKGSIILANQEAARWIVKLDEGVLPAAAMVLDVQRNIYVIGTNAVLYSISPLGQIRWKLKLLDSVPILTTFSDLLAQNDGILGAFSDGTLFKVSIDGKILWKTKFASEIVKTFSADKDENIYLPLTNNRFGESDTLACLNKNGKTLWKKPFANCRFTKPAVVTNDRIYIAGLKKQGEDIVSTLLVMDKRANKIWEQQMPYVPRFISVDAEGTIFVAGYNTGVGQALSCVYCFDANGQKKWQKFFEATIPTPVMISEKKIAFVSVENNTTGVVFMDKKGVMFGVISLDEAPLVYLQPVVTSEACIVFAGIDKFYLVKIDDTPLNKILPF